MARSGLSQVPSFWLRHADKDVRSPVVAQLKGQLPAWLRGALYRNGSGIKQIGPDKYNHLFDGLACLHKFDIDGSEGRVTYQSRFLESDHYKANAAAGRIEMTEFATLGRQDLCRTVFGRLMSTFQDLRGGKRRSVSDNCAVNVGFMGGRLYAMTEGNKVWRVSEEDLSAEKQVDLTRVVAVDSATAHPHVLPDGTVYNIGNSFSRQGSFVNFIEFAPGGDQLEGRIVGRLPHRWPLEPTYFHSFGITANYFVFVQQPLVIQVKKMPLLKLRGKPITEAIAAKPEHGTWIRLIDRHTGRVHPVTFSCDAVYTFHHVNAYEESGEAVVDVCCSLPGPRSMMEIATMEYLATDGEEGDNPMLRFRLPLNEQTGGTVHCTPQRLGPPEYRSLDLPRINYAYNGRPYRYAYACRFVGAAGNSERLVKLDLVSGSSLSWSDALWSPSEPVFVPSPDPASAEDSAEDSGVLLASLLHVSEPRRTALLLLDARDMSELARAEVDTDATVAKDFHGLFAAAGEAVHGY